jgi:acyl-CoA thioesterase FadM
MYPALRLGLITLSERRKAPLGLFDRHVLPLRCLPWDLDGFLEMNNGRVLTLYDLGRFAMSIRVGLWDKLREQRWGLVVAGSSVRYRARITGFQRFDLHTRLIGWDHRFFYIEQAMWRGDTCCNHALLRTGVTARGRLAPVHSVTEALGHAGPAPALPGWVTAWTEADADRPWPPMRDDGASP